MSSVGSDDDASTDSECEYDSHPITSDMIPEGLDDTAVFDTYRMQRGLCRLTGVPFGRSDDPLYAPHVVPRVFAHAISNDNNMIVLTAIAKMREQTDLAWRPFVAFLRTVLRDPEL